MKLDEKAWKTFQQHVGYNDEEILLARNGGEEWTW
jgi:hypothetical protein